MGKCKTIIFFLSLFFIINKKIISQNRAIDSLQRLLKTDLNDTIKIKHLNDLAWEMSYINIDTAFILCNKALSLAGTLLKNEKRFYVEKTINTLIGDSYSQKASFNFYKGNYQKALEYYQKSLEIFDNMLTKTPTEQKTKSSNNRYLLVKSSLDANIAGVYYSQGNYPLALEYYFRALKIDEMLHFKSGLTANYGNIGNIYSEQGNVKKALEFYKKALKISEEINDKSMMAAWLENIGVSCQAQKKYNLAMEYFEKAFKLDEEQQNHMGMANIFGSIGAVNVEQSQVIGISEAEQKRLLDSAMSNFLKALKIFNSLGSKSEVVNNMLRIGNLYMNQKKYKEAESYFIKAISMAEEIGSLSDRLLGYNYLSKLFEHKADYKSALSLYKKHALMKDSLFNEEKNKELTKHEMNYEFEKKEVASKAEQDKKDAVTVAEEKKQRAMLVLVCCALLLVFVFSGFVFRSLKITRKQKTLIELKNKETEEQKQIIEEKNKGIMDSIYYARRIQNSLLPTEKYLEKNINTNQR